jgi:hypothetical protein
MQSEGNGNGNLKEGECKYVGSMYDKGQQWHRQ